MTAASESAVAADAGPSPVQPRRAARAERRFYSGYTLAILLAIVVGFAPSFFLRGLVEPFGALKPLSPTVLVHGVVTTLWVLLFPLQAWLHRATLLGSGILAVDMFGRLAVAQTAAWAGFVRMLPGFGTP